MQPAKAEIPSVTITGRHVSVTDAMREHAEKKLAHLNFDYPRVIDAKVLLDVEKDRHKAEIILHCANHITIEADSTTGNMYTSIDETIHKVARQMRKQKTRMLKSHRPDRGRMGKIKQAALERAPGGLLSSEEPEGSQDFAAEEDLTFLAHREVVHLRALDEREAAEALELTHYPFLAYKDERTGKLCIVYRREDGDYGIVCPANNGG